MSLLRQHYLKFLLCGLLLAGCATLSILSNDSLAARSKTRTYYIAAEDVLWDYAPSYPLNTMSGEEFSEDQKVFVDGEPDDRIGRRYWKALYRAYTDETFTAPKPRPAGWEHLGALGPTIRASVGDTIVVVFKNNTADKTLSVHPHGLFYGKASEGTPYNDETSDDDKADDAVPPGATHTYVWEIPERAGPGRGDPSSIVWMYHSHVDEPADTNAGLVGPIVITGRGMARADGSPRDVDREIVNLFTVFDENVSPYLDQNIAEFAPSANPEDEDFQESNLMHAINGYLYGNVPNMTMKTGERVRWHLIGLGTEVDLHTPHWHGNTVISGRAGYGQRTDVVELLPASMKTVTMRPDNPGVWMYHCHVNDHIDAGMMALYTVDANEGHREAGDDLSHQ